MSKQRKQIEKAAQELGIELKNVEWEAIGSGAEMCGPSGGWDVETTDGRHFYGYNVAEVIEDMDKSVRFGWEQRQFELGHRHGVRNAATEKDAEIARLKDLVAALSDAESKRPDVDRVINQIKRDALRTFIRAVWCHVPYLQDKAGIHTPWPNYGAAIQDIMSESFGSDWISDDYAPPLEQVVIKQSDPDHPRISLRRELWLPIGALTFEKWSAVLDSMEAHGIISPQEAKELRIGVITMSTTGLHRDGGIAR